MRWGAAATALAAEAGAAEEAAAGQPVIAVLVPRAKAGQETELLALL